MSSVQNHGLHFRLLAVDAQYRAFSVCAVSKPLVKVFGQVVRAKRERMGISQEKLAFKAKLHRTYISLVERGERNPSLMVIATLASVLGTTMWELLKEVEDTNRRAR